MALRLQIISRHRQGLGERGSMEFGRNGGTIGRSLESDWVLPDGQRYLSSRHASIDYRSGSYYIVDTSTNGVYVNDAEQPVGRGNPQRLFSGDRIRLGEYEISVEIRDEDDTRETLADDQ
ncbi:MAG TPA: type VI secretion system-associated FHA domain protein TagH, partial [Gammaproteobacteria bacterium]|nr:type VI secretion system-associated FHA domain protein TagH [Gammaproteobacteria bacterium]